MQLYFIRHAQSANNALWDATGTNEGRSEDPQLTEIGIKQAERLAEYISRPWEPVNGSTDPQNLGGFGITHLYCSLMERSVRTGAAISRASGIPLQGWKDLHETGGIFLWDEEKEERVGLPGKTRTYFKTTYPEFMLPDDVTDDGWWNRGFELDEEQLPRGRRVIARLLEMHGGTEDRVAIVSHGGFFQVFLTALLDLEVEQHTWFTMNNAAITRISFRENGTYIIYTNRVGYLTPDLIT